MTSEKKQNNREEYNTINNLDDDDDEDITSNSKEDEEEYSITSLNSQSTISSSSSDTKKIPHHSVYLTPTSNTDPTSKCLFLTSILFIAIGFGTLASFFFWPEEMRYDDDGYYGSKKKGSMRSNGIMVRLPRFPMDLFRDGTYGEKDFVNEEGYAVPYWDDVRDYLISGNKSSTTTSKMSSTSPNVTWGPCYPSLTFHTSNNHNTLPNTTTSSPILHYPRYSRLDPNSNSLLGKCHPSFIIIGAGKCGTSSLYHYLTSHPRILPAKEKQIHYFKYFTHESMGWYLSHFPTTSSFLQNGGLMTGEASPGYMPYPDVADRLYRKMEGIPKIVAVVRDPIERAWSSYKYNYVEPALKKLRRQHVRNVPRGKDDRFYRLNYLFTFEEMVRAELDVLKDCLKEGGVAEVGARKSYGKWSKDEYEKRDREQSKELLLDIDGQCYGERVSRYVPRKQWINLTTQHPERIINLPNLQLVQSIIGRGIYSAQLDWWYIKFPKDQLYVFCTEELSTPEEVSRLSTWLGVPTFDYTSVLEKGRYNVGGFRGYDKLVPVNKTKKAIYSNKNNHSLLNNDEEFYHGPIPLSHELRQELKDFYEPFNERLFRMTGKRCRWS